MELKKASYASPVEPGKRGFEDLECFQLALNVIVNTHEFAKRLPAEEKFDMASQVRASSKSVTANIAKAMDVSIISTVSSFIPTRAARSMKRYPITSMREC